MKKNRSPKSRASVPLKYRNLSGSNPDPERVVNIMDPTKRSGHTGLDII
jgi:hypothetical protein